MLNINAASEKAKYCMNHLILCILGDNAITTTWSGYNQPSDCHCYISDPGRGSASGLGWRCPQRPRCPVSRPRQQQLVPGCIGRRSRGQEPWTSLRTSRSWWLCTICPLVITRKISSWTKAWFQVNVSTKLLEQADILLLEQEDSGYVGDIFGFWVEGVIQVSSQCEGR